MATEKATVDYVVDQLGDLNVRTRAMFGEYALYCDEKVAGFICDDTLFLKTGSAIENDLNDAWLGPCYPGSKDYYGIPGDCLEDHEWLQTHVQAVADSL